jgi:hypothetical protein
MQQANSINAANQCELTRRVGQNHAARNQTNMASRFKPCNESNESTQQLISTQAASKNKIMQQNNTIRAASHLNQSKVRHEQTHFEFL